MNISEVRNLFPHLKTGQIYFNHAAVGPWSSPVLDRINEFTIQRSGAKIENYQSFMEWNLGAKQKLGKILGAPSDRIAWVDNVSNGLNILAHGLDWKAGDRIILNDMEFPANVYPFLNLQTQGVEIDLIKSHNGIVDIGDIAHVITTNTKLISISLVQFLSGYRCDIDAIGDLCRSNGIIFCVDAIQGAGVVEIDVQKAKIDFLAGGTQKWFMSSQGLSYVYLTEELQNRINQKYVGWTSVDNAWDFLDYNLTLKTSAERFQNGTLNVLGVAVFDSMLDLFLSYGMRNIEKNVLDNTKYFIEKLISIGINPILKDVPEKKRAGIVSFKHNNSKNIYEELESRKIYCAVREGMIRFSPHFYNITDEIDEVVNVLEKILKGG
ncbi:MAG: aminotransferase [Ignavibacteriae bacterium HGW-Ignavibacteriae-3]|nr:MAG: aminotransferase [Ignavibacteriae bacterium HGW-Ignavibacteriae-3]